MKKDLYVFVLRRRVSHPGSVPDGAHSSLQPPLGPQWLETNVPMTTRYRESDFTQLSKRKATLGDGKIDFWLDQASLLDRDDGEKKQTDMAYDTTRSDKV